MSDEIANPATTSSHPLKIICLSGLIVATVIGTGSYVSSQRHEAEPTVEHSSGLIEMVFGMR